MRYLNRFYFYKNELHNLNEYKNESIKQYEIWLTYFNIKKIKEVLLLIEKNDKKKFKKLCYLIIFGGLIELISVTFLYQIIKIFSLGPKINEDKFTNIVSEFFDIIE